ncbi:chromosomal replication initiator DnaA [Burkholderia sp. Ax-1724]|nr:chromosomal replication initiator DnaA [Burkholderia sp. Ax-1724]
MKKLTESFCVRNGVPISQDEDDDEYGLPRFDLGDGKMKSVILVPSDIVRELPIANDASEIYAAISANDKIRNRVNAFLGAGARHTITEKKSAMRQAALESADYFALFLKAIKEFAKPYSPADDVLGYYKLKELLTADNTSLKTEKKFDLSTGIDGLISVVKASLEMFKHHVEKGNLWEALWAEGSPKRERAAQLLYFAIADSFCKANNIDISPEANMGGGPIDFKFSKGYEARVLVEMKRSSGTVKHGYEKQLEFYKDAARTFHGVFVVIDFGDLGKKLAAIEKIRTARLADGASASDIVVIDATPKESASKRE